MNEPRPDFVDISIAAHGLLDPANAAELQQRAIELFAGVHGLSYNVTLGEPKPESSARDEESEAMHAWLDSSLQDALKNSGASVRTANRLGQEHVQTFRDALLLGEVGLSDIRNFGSKSIAEVQAVLENNDFGLRLQEAPTMADAAAICEGLHQLPERFIDAPLFEKPYRLVNKSVADILAMPVTEIAASYVVQNIFHLTLKHFPEDTQKAFEAGVKQVYIDQAKNYKQRAQECARHFAALKATAQLP